MRHPFTQLLFDAGPIVNGKEYMASASSLVSFKQYRPGPTSPLWILMTGKLCSLYSFLYSFVSSSSLMKRAIEIHRQIRMEKRSPDLEERRGSRRGNGFLCPSLTQ